MKNFRNGAWLALSAVAMLANLSGQCQSRLEVLFTNRVVSFTNLQGQVCADASLVRASTDQVIFKTNDIYGTVKFTNLAPEVLEYLGVPESHLKLVRERQARLAEQAARELAMVKAELAKLLDPANLIKVKIESVVWTDYDALYGSVQQCQLRWTNDAVALAYVARLPATITDYLNKQQALARAVAQLTSQIATGNAQLRNGTARVNQAESQAGRSVAAPVTMPSVQMQTNHGASISSHYVNHSGTGGDQSYLIPGDLIAAREKLNEWTSQLKQLQTELDAMNQKGPSITNLLVLPSQFKHNGGAMVICSTNQVQDTAGGVTPK